MERTEKMAADGSGFFIYEGDRIVGFRPASEGQGETPAPTADEGGNGVLKEAGLAIVGGVRDGVQELGNTIQWAGESIGNFLTGGRDVYYTKEGGFEWLTPEEVKSGQYTIPEWQTRDLIGDEGIIGLPEVAENETMAGGMVRGVTQFVTGYGAIGKLAQGLRVMQGAGAVSRGLVLGAGTDFATFDAHEDRFSDFLRDNVGLQDPITEFLSADEDDTILEGKLKNAIEGLGLGVATEGVVQLVKLFKRAKRVQIESGDEAAAEVMNDGLTELSDQLELFDETTDPNLAKEAHSADMRVVGGKSAGVTDEAPAQPKSPEAAGEVSLANAKAAGVDPAPERPAVNTEALQRQLDYEIGLRRAGTISDPERVVEGDLFNFGRMDADVDTMSILNMATDSIVEYGIKDTTTFEAMAKDATNWMADYVDASPEVVVGSLRRMAEDAKRQQGLIIAAKNIQLSLTRDVENLAEKVALGRATDEDKVLMLRRQQQLVEMAALNKSVIRGAAQTTAAGRIITTDALSGQQLAAADIAKQIGDAVAQNGDKIDAMARAIVANRAARGGAGSVLRISAHGAKGLLRKGNEVVNEVYINSILSGPKTHMINIISNGLNTVWLPTEKMIGGALGGNGQVMREGFRQYNGIRLALFDSIKAAGAALRAGRNILDPEAAILEANGVDYHAIRSESENPVVNTLVNGLGSFIRIPSRLLMGGDELFKQINYRSNLYSRLMSEATDLVAQGKIKQSEAQEWVFRRMEVAFDHKTGAAKSQVDLDYAREATFTQPLRRDSELGSFALSVQNMTNQYPPLKLVLPFVRTPSNILKAGLQRTPFLHKLSKTMREDLASGDPRRVAAARGKLATGAAIYGAAVMLAVEGKITGSGPSDPALKARLMDTGWRPYSVRVEKSDGSVEYIEYRRLEPFAMILGSVADIVSISGEASEMDAGELSAAAAIAISNNIASKTFLQGIVDAVEAFSDPERYMRSFMLNYASAMVPQSAFLREVRKVGDPASRDVRNLTDAIMNTIPGFSQNVPARRSWITGEPILYPAGWGAKLSSPVGDALAATNPIYAGDWKQDPVLDELARLNFGFSAPTRKVTIGRTAVDLNEEQYSRLLELHGTVRHPTTKRTMHDELARLFATKRYDINREKFGDVSDPNMNERIKAVQRVISAYRKAARNQLIREFPELREKAVQVAYDAESQRRSALAGIADLAD